MPIALQVIAYDVSRYINSMLLNAAPWVDKIFIAYPPRPWDYIPSSRDSRRNPTKLTELRLQDLPCEIEIIEGDWLKDEDTRNSCFNLAIDQGFDWMIVQDADEFYTKESWTQLREVMQSTSLPAFKTTWYQFWKSSEYVLVDRTGSIKGSNALFAVRCQSEFRFIRARSINLKEMPTVDASCYHYGYVKSDREMFEKVSQWSHADRLDGARWHRLKWLNWGLHTRNLWPMNPVAYPKAIRFPLHQPDFAQQFALPVRPVEFGEHPVIENFLYDCSAWGYDKLQQAKRAWVRSKAK